jgi:hypothetical protein
MDLALRLACTAQCADLIVELPPFEVPLASRRLADKLAIPLLALYGVLSVRPAEITYSAAIHCAASR